MKQLYKQVLGLKSYLNISIKLLKPLFYIKPLIGRWLVNDDNGFNHFPVLTIRKNEMFHISTSIA